MAAIAPVIPLPDFQRIANAAAGLILSEGVELIGKCVLFGIMGERLLRSKYRINDARAIVGAFSVCISPSEVIAFAGHQGSTDNRQNFHCWVEAAGWIFDFSSFLYPELARKSLGAACKPLMFQKPASQVAEASDAIKKPGDFYFREDRALREITIDSTLRPTAMQDILEILEQWYLPPPKKMPIIGVADSKGNTKPAALHNSILLGAW